MKYETKLFIVRGLVTYGINYLFNSTWQILEIFYYGEIRPDEVDTIMSLFVLVSIYLNVKHWIKDVLF